MLELSHLGLEKARRESMEMDMSCWTHLDLWNILLPYAGVLLGMVSMRFSVQYIAGSDQIKGINRQMIARKGTTWILTYYYE